MRAKDKVVTTEEYKLVGRHELFLKEAGDPVYVRKVIYSATPKAHAEKIACYGEILEILQPGTASVTNPEPGTWLFQWTSKDCVVHQYYYVTSQLAGLFADYRDQIVPKVKEQLGEGSPAHAIVEVPYSMDDVELQWLADIASERERIIREDGLEFCLHAIVGGSHITLVATN